MICWIDYFRESMLTLELDQSKALLDDCGPSFVRLLQNPS